VVFAAVSVALAVARQRHEADRAALAEKERASLVERVAQQAAGPDPSTADRWGTAGFTGRYRHGPESAPIRIVVFTDYQCPDCAQVEGEIERLLATRDDLSLSVKHFPMNAQCNPHVKETLHDNACWAARVAETAGIVGGEQAFWKMHRWLFSVHGIFVTTADLAEGVAAAGLDMASFIPVLEGHEPLQRIRADIEDGMALGLYFTPMVFVNGVEVKWSFSPMDSVTTAVEALAAKALPARTAVADRPALAAEKFVDDWRIQPARPVRPVQLSWPLGADGSSATVDVVVFGNYGAASVKQVDHELRDALMTRPHVRYSFRHYPLSADCNPALPENVQSSALEPLDCVASRAALAAGTVGGTSAFWRMHDFILARSSVRDEIDVREAARDIGLDEALVLRAMDEPRITTAIADDCHAARDLAIRSLPLVIVAGRRVPRPLREGDSILARIIDEASRAAPSAAASAP
jgi:protein-disulfide isomerase